MAGDSGKLNNAKTVTVPGKVILVGEHAVVHGQPAIALPFWAVTVKAVAMARPGGLAVESTQPGLSVAGLLAAAEATLRYLGRSTDDVVVRVDSTVPPGAGLGSSAATAVAVVRAIAAWDGADLSVAQVAALADVAERHAHGAPSGLDVATVQATGPIFFQRGEEPRPLAVSGDWHFLAADTGRPRDTRAAVAAVTARLAESEEAGWRIGALGELAVAIAKGLTENQQTAVGEAMNAAHAHLAALGVADEGLDGLVSVARSAGALGAKLTGAGRGGCLLALVPQAQVSHVKAALLAARARQVWETVWHDS